MPLISSLLKEILSTIHHHTAFLVADISLLRKSGKNFDYIKVLYYPSSNTFVSAHRTLILCLVIDKLTILIHLRLLFDERPVDALIQALESLLPWLTEKFKKLIFLCDAGLTCNKLINFLLDRGIDFVCVISQNRVDEYSGMKLRKLCFEEPSVIKLKGVSRKLYAYRIGEGTDKDRVVIR